MKINETKTECCTTLVGNVPAGSVVKMPVAGEGFFLVAKVYNPPWQSPWRKGFGSTSEVKNVLVVNLATGDRLYVSPGRSCVVYPDASLCPGAPA